MMFWAKIGGFYIVFVLWIIYAEMIFVNEDSATTFLRHKIRKMRNLLLSKKKCLNSLKCDLTSKKGKARWVWEGGWRGRAESFSVGQVTRSAGRPSRLKIAVCCPTGSCKLVVLKLPKSYQKVVSILSKSCLNFVQKLSQIVPQCNGDW